MAVSASWLDPITNFDLSTSTVVTESIWDNVMSDIEYIGAAVEPDTLVNRAGGTLTAGTVVIADVSIDKSFTTTAVASDVRVIGIVMDTIANGASGRIGAAGVIDVKMHTPVTRGNFIGAGSAASYAKDIGASKIEGSFGISLSTILNGASASVPVLVRTSLGGGGGASLVASNIQLSNGSLVFTENAAGSNVVALRPPSAILNDVTWTMPDHVGTSGQVLATLGTGGANTFYWASKGEVVSNASYLVLNGTADFSNERIIGPGDVPIPTGLSSIDYGANSSFIQCTFPVIPQYSNNGLIARTEDTDTSAAHSFLVSNGFFRSGSDTTGLLLSLNTEINGGQASTASAAGVTMSIRTFGGDATCLLCVPLSSIQTSGGTDARSLYTRVFINNFVGGFRCYSTAVLGTSGGGIPATVYSDYRTIDSVPSATSVIAVYFSLSGGTNILTGGLLVEQIRQITGTTVNWL